MRKSRVECGNLGLNAEILGRMRKSRVECGNLGLNAEI